MYHNPHLVRLFQLFTALLAVGAIATAGGPIQNYILIGFVVFVLVIVACIPMTILYFLFWLFTKDGDFSRHKFLFIAFTYLPMSLLLGLLIWGNITGRI